MGSGGTEWESGDNFDPIRLNQKTIFVGTGEQATSLILNPQIGQMVYSIKSDSTFTKDKISFYNSSWICPHINEHDEENSGDVSGGGTSGGNTRFYRFITLPTTYKFYIITAIELGDGGGPNAGSAIAGVDVVNADPPTNNSSVLVALATLFSLSAGSGPSIKNTNVISKPIRGGSVLGAWVNTSADNTVTLTSTLGTYFKIMAYDTSPEFANNTTFIYNALTGVPAIKIYYRGYD